MKYIFLILLTAGLILTSNAQEYWQQHVSYKMDIDFDHKNHQFKGNQTLVYTNNSPDTLNKVYYHLFYNAFQPNSMMEWNRRLNPGPDPRFVLMDSIADLQPDEIGYQKIKSLKQNGKSLDYEVSETILEVKLAEPILPGSKVTFEMDFEAQVPLQIRRTGRNSYDGVDYSMAQWFPKICEYDPYGWHDHPYIDQEFYSPWGDYEVNITIAKEFTLAGTGIIQNPNEVGHGYEDKGIKIKYKSKDVTWKFKAENVHDFVWAADTEYEHQTAQVPNGPLLRFFYLKGPDTDIWRNELPGYTVKCFEYAQKEFGNFGWPQYSVIQGGDGGMEYMMATLIINKKRSTGIRSLSSLVGTMAHEVMHSWYQGMLATNEIYYPWMDEGFASYTDEYVINEIMGAKEKNPTRSTVDSYVRWVNTGKEEAAIIPADYHSDYWTSARASYTKGEVALVQLNYIIGEEILHSALRKYRNQWGFKHPHPIDFIKVVEKESNLELRWFFDFWINTTKTIDYGIEGLNEVDGKAQISLEKIGDIPMPLELTITLTDNSQFQVYIPIGLMRGEKIKETELDRIVMKDWYWTHPKYTFELDIPMEKIKRILIDESERMADVDKSNNAFIQ